MPEDKIGSLVQDYANHISVVVKQGTFSGDGYYSWLGILYEFALNLDKIRSLDKEPS